MNCILNSNSGRECFSLYLSDKTGVDNENCPFVVCEIQLKSKCYLDLENIFDGDFYHSLHLKAVNLVISLGRLQLLYEKLAGWLEKEIPFNLNLMNDNGRKIDIVLDVSNQMITSRSKPLFQISYSNGVSEGFSNSFVIDQSCIRIFTENLENAIGG